MNKEGYTHLILDRLCLEFNEQKDVESKLNNLVQSGFTLQHQEQDGFWLFRK